MAERTNDDMILEAIFNPSLQGEATSSTAKNCSDITEDEGNTAYVLTMVKKLENEAVLAAENGDYEKSLSIFDNAINIAPTHASSYNNRAQLYRLQG